MKNSTDEEGVLADLRVDRRFGQPNKHTFLIYPIKKLLAEELTGGVWLDPFAGFNSPASLTNDINPETPAMDHLDALEWLRKHDPRSADGVIYDPPYSMYQAKTAYQNHGASAASMNMRYWADCKDAIAAVIKPGGKAICFGWTSQGIGKSRGFCMSRVLLVPHGGSRNDTIVTVESAAGLPLGAGLVGE